MTVRKGSANLSSNDTKLFLDVIKQLVIAPGDPNPYGNFVDIHNMSIIDHRMHGRHIMNGMIMSDPMGSKRFLCWHRDYLLNLEKIGQKIDSKFFIPFWDWTTERQVPGWILSYKPTVKVAGNNIIVKRNPQSPDLLPTQTDIDKILKKKSFLLFTHALEGGPHNFVHGWVNGTMSSVPTAPADPIFWMHHAQIDRIWSMWQKKFNGGPKSGPTLSGHYAVMDPWNEKVSDLLSISNLGYSYEN